MSGLRDWVRDCIVNCKTSGKLNPANAAEVLMEKLAEKADADGCLPDGAQPLQQLVTDGEGVAKWEDRLAYKGIVESVVLPEQTAKIEYYQYFGYCQIGGFEPELYANEDGTEKDIKVGRTYIFTIDGVEYRCAAKYGVNNVSSGSKSVYIGNADVNGYGDQYDDDYEDTGEPFLFVPTYDGVYTLIMREEDEGEHTISLRAVDEEVHKIDPKYLPEGVFVVDVDMETMTASHSAIDIGTAIQDGQVPILRVQPDQADVYAVKLISAETDNGYRFIGWGIMNAYLTAMMFVVHPDKTVEYEELKVAEMPG